jgi:cellulose synthase operon protein C
MIKSVGFGSLRSTGAALVLAMVLAGCGSPEQRAQEYYDSGMALIAKKDDLAARLELLKAVKYKSDKVEVWRALAGIDERTKSTSLFLDLRRIVELDPNDLDARVRLARIMLSGGAAEPALKVLDAATEGEKPNAALHGLKALVLLRASDASGALREAQRAYAIDPGNGDAVAVLASAKVKDRDLDGALKLLDGISADSKEQTRATLQKVEIYTRKGDFAKAETLLRGLMSQNPGDQTYQPQLIQLLLAQKKFDDAEKEFRSRVAAHPGDAKAGMDLVRFLMTTRGATAGRAELEALSTSNGRGFDYEIALADLDVAQNKFDDATERLKSLAAGTESLDKKLAAKVKLAELYLSRSDKASAEPLIGDVLTQDNKNAGALRLRAALRIEKGDVDNAISDIRQALNDQPKSAELLSLLAIAYERGGKNELADRQYADGLKSSNYNPEIVLRYAAFLQRRGDPARAEDILSEAVGRNANNFQLLSSLAQVRLNRQNWTGALDTADVIGKSAEGRALADQIRAAALAGQNKLDESIVALEDAHKVAPNAIQPTLALASSYLRQGSADKAAALLEETSKKNPGNSQLLVFLGQAKLAQKKDDEAFKSFQAAIAQQPKEPAGYISLSDLNVRNKNYDAAENVLASGLKEQPQNVSLRLSLAGLQILKGNNDAAIAQYEAILKDQATLPIAVNNLASLLLDNRSDPQSLSRALSLAETLKGANLPQFQDTLGWAQYKQGNFKDAIATLEPAAAKQPNLAALRYHLGMSYAAAGQKDKAIEQFKAALALEPDETPLKKSIQAALN